MVAREDLHLLAALEHDVDQRVEVLRLLRFLAHLGEDRVPADCVPNADTLVLANAAAALVADEADLIGVHEVVAVREVDLLVLELDPDDLLDQLVPPPLHDLDGGVELAVEDPEEDEALVGEEVERDAGDL